MLRNKNKFNKTAKDINGRTLLLEQITPLAHQINCLDMEHIANVCVDKIARLVGVRFVSLYILDEDNNILHLQKHNHPFAINKIVSLSQEPPSAMVMAVRSKEFMLIGNIDDHRKPVIKKSQRPFAENYKTGTCAVSPLLCQDRVIGVLNLTDKIEGDNFGYDDIALIELFSQLVGASIGNIKLFEKMQRQATTDGLTGLTNYKTFYDTLEKELWRSRRYGGTISLVMIDIDNFKNINDTYGHRAGDKVIKEISRRIKECIRQIDTAARYGGDEFAVILPNTALAEATVVAERMVAAVSNSAILWGKHQIHLSISVGLGQYESDISPEDITSRSDEALYTAKQVGGNTVRIFKPSYL